MYAIYISPSNINTNLYSNTMHSNASMLAISRYKTGLELGFGIKNYFEPLLIKSNLNLALNKL